MTETRDDATTIRGKGSRTRPVTLVAPRQVPLTPEQELAAIDALTQLLADWVRERRGGSTRRRPHQTLTRHTGRR